MKAEETMRNGLLVKFHPQRLSDEDLTLGVERFFETHDHAPHISGFMLDALMNEQCRRLQSRGGHEHETGMIVLPAATWSATDLTQGLNVLTAMSYQACSEQLGKLIDTLVRVFTCAVGARAIVLENMIHARLENGN